MTDVGHGIGNGANDVGNGTGPVDQQLAFYERDPLYRFTEGDARHLADEVLRLRAAIREVLGRSDVGVVSYEILRQASS